MYAEIGRDATDYATAIITYGARVADAKQFNILISQIECSSIMRSAHIC